MSRSHVVFAALVSGALVALVAVLSAMSEPASPQVDAADLDAEPTV
ncbi:hypothetical protein [Kutzneria buriramensis]|uniref:Uncharacterized protein n=1 Tax=Kutzneria buriramensis TaxID=1045776 RepID=A0A3E0GVJ2_9PSEU|nr:hypothetical protein [Kutzneria buriramensis]REH26957.1 hypothetical protein BCF44_13112 [Kutzneria buriramensis]